MAKRRPIPTGQPAQPQIFAASLGAGGSVLKGQQITQVQAEARRKAGQDVVVCGPNLATNRSLAAAIEAAAVGKAKRCPPHPSAGPQALPHYQPDPRPPAGHTFYETPQRKAV
jgi:hypothetical protein